MVPKQRTNTKPKARKEASAKVTRSSRSLSKLRQMAEQKLGGTKRGAEAAVHEKTQKLVHELQVHKVELEIQNEELRRIQLDLLETQASLEEARDRFRSHFDFSPIGHVSVRANGTVADPNLAAVALLGAPADQLRRRLLSSFIARRDRRA